MSRTTNHIPPHLQSLMIEQATQGLSGKDKATLQAELAKDAVLRREAEAYELAATAIALSLTQQTNESLPSSLRAKLIEQAQQAHLLPPGSEQSRESSTDLAPGLRQTTMPATPNKDVVFSFTDGRMFGWYAAIAALIALAFVLAFEPKPNQTITPEPEAFTLIQQYDALASTADTVFAQWGFAGDRADPAYANATGEVIWNADKQAGYMKLTGLPVNNPIQTQYQLWIVDGSRNTEIENTNRIDGGVFDITAQGEVIVPIDAKLIARDAAAFAITVETPGGVVESKGPLQMLAVVDTAG